MLVAMMTPLLLAGVVGPADAAAVTATLPAEPLTPGEAYTFTLDFDPGEGWSASEAGIPYPMLQIDVPKSATLAGRVLKDHRELAKNEFLQAPYERLIEPGANQVEFTLDTVPEASEHFGLNVIAYVKKGDGDARFFRQRLHLPLRAGASAKDADESDTSWGDDGSGLQVGDRAVSFSLPRADGTMLELEDLLGKHNILLTTYRAHW